MAISNVKVGTSNTIVFEAPALEEHAVTTMFFCNISLTDALLDLYLVPGASAITTGSQIIQTLSLPKSETFVFDAEKLILANGDKIVAATSVGTDQLVIATVSTVKTS